MYLTLLFLNTSSSQRGTYISCLKVIGSCWLVSFAVAIMMRLYTATLLTYFSIPALTEGSVTVRSADDLNYDENGRLEKHTLLYPEGKCADFVEQAVENSVYGFELYAVADNAEDSFLKGPDWKYPMPSTIESIDDCHAVCLERGVDRPYVTTPMPSRKFRGRRKGEEAMHDESIALEELQPFSSWFKKACLQVEMNVQNYLNDTIAMYWVDSEGKQHPNSVLEHDQQTQINSFLGHTFEFVNLRTKETVLRHRVEFTTTFGIGETPPHGERKGDIADQVYEYHKQEWRKMNNVHRTFSQLGFKKGRLPDDLWANMGAFHYNNRNNKVRENWNGNGIFVNWWEVDVFFIAIPRQLKFVWQDRLKKLVEDWVGEPLEETSMYGLRRYEEGARLLTHVDRETTHAASLIVNVAQSGVSEPWPVEIHDHAGRLHQITMDPGDIVYYESAACLHGRNTPLKGENAFYVNLFTHYRPVVGSANNPVGDPEWQYKANKPNTPSPLMDVGECRLEGSIDMIGVGAVKCDNPAIGPYLSPYMVTAKSEKDLFDWWNKVGPPNDEEETGPEYEPDYEKDEL